jgi:hypothetical protein
VLGIELRELLPLDVETVERVLELELREPEKNEREVPLELLDEYPLLPGHQERRRGGQSSFGAAAPGIGATAGPGATVLWGGRHSCLAGVMA